MIHQGYSHSQMILVPGKQRQLLENLALHNQKIKLKKKLRADS